MKVLILTPWFPSHPEDQSGNFIFESVNALHDLGVKFQVLVIKPWIPSFMKGLHGDWARPEFDATAFNLGYPIEVTKFLSFPRNYLRALSNFLLLKLILPKIIKSVEKNGVNLLHAHTEFMGLLAKEVNRKTGLPYVVSLHGINTAKKLQTPDYQNMLKDVLNCAEKIIVVGEPLLKHFSHGVLDEKKFRLVYNGFQFIPEMLKPKSHDWPDTIKFISVSNLHEGKGIDLNISAFAELEKSGITHWHYTIVGAGREEDNLRQQCQQFGITDKVSFLGELSHDRVLQALLASNVFVLPSYREAFGIVYLEAMACGLLTMAVKGQGASAFISDDETGLLLEPQDTSSIKASLSRIFTEPKKLQLIAQHGQEYVLKNFRWSNHAEQLKSVYDEVGG